MEKILQIIYFLIFPHKFGFDKYMQIVTSIDNLHEMSNPFRR